MEADKLVAEYPAAKLIFRDAPPEQGVLPPEIVEQIMSMLGKTSPAGAVNVASASYALYEAWRRIANPCRLQAAVRRAQNAIELYQYTDPENKLVQSAAVALMSRSDLPVPVRWGPAPYTHEEMMDGSWLESREDVPEEVDFVVF